MIKETSKYHRLKSVAIWVEIDTKTLYPCKEDGTVFRDNGISLHELNTNWFTLLDMEDKEFLSNLVNNN